MDGMEVWNVRCTPEHEYPFDMRTSVDSCVWEIIIMNASASASAMLKNKYDWFQ